MAPRDDKSCVHGVKSCRSTRIVVLSVAGHGTELRTYEQMSGYYMDTKLSQLHRTLPPHGAAAVCFLATPGTQTILDVHAHGVRFELFLRSPMKPARAPGRRALPGHLQGQGSKYCNITWPAASGRPHVSHRLRDALAPRSYARRLMRTCQLMHASVFTRNCARGE